MRDRANDWVEQAERKINVAKAGTVDEVLGGPGPSAGGRPRGFWRQFLAFVGPGYLVATGYMDPGNWATSIAGGSTFGYQLLFVALLSSLMAIVMQSLAARLGIASGRDLAEMCREVLPRPVSLVLWALAELAICATDLAEVIGTAIGLNLLFGIPIGIGTLLTAADVFLILALQRLGFRWIEAFVMALLVLIAVCFFGQLLLAKPEWSAVAAGLIPNPSLLANPTALYLAIGMIGATVMPHNLYLHSSLPQTTRDLGEGLEQRRRSLNFVTLDTVIALSFALVINVSLIVVAAASFYAHGQQSVTELPDAYRLIAPLLGAPLAATLFAIALLACGFNSTITATLSGQIVMEGFLTIRLPNWLRRLVTRAIAIIPAVITVLWFGESFIGRLLILSQVVLSLQLPFAMFPLIWFTASRAYMGGLVAPRWLTGLGLAIAVLISLLNIWLIAQMFGLGLSAAAG
jgi:manganese transport protein